MFSLRTSSLLRTAGIAAAVLAAMAASASRSEAACGNYVHIDESGAADSTPAPMQKPCDGPNCSNQQPPPITPMSDPVLEWDSGKSLVRPAGESPAADALHSRLTGPCAPALPDPITSSIFHPPRAV